MEKNKSVGKSPRRARRENEGKRWRRTKVIESVHEEKEERMKVKKGIDKSKLERVH